MGGQIEAGTQFQLLIVRSDKITLILLSAFRTPKREETLCYFFFSNFFFKLEDNCFTIVCWPLPQLNMNQPQAYTGALPPEHHSRLPPHRTPLGQRRARVWVELPVSPSTLPLAIYFTCGHLSVSGLFSQSAPLPFPSARPPERKTIITYERMHGEPRKTVLITLFAGQQWRHGESYF